jgi:Flp pilus assembly protein TadD
LLAGAWLVAVAAAGCASAGASAPAASSQIDFGVDMARRGLWQEALFRFEQARRERPGDAKILNNLAVAYEAVGRFDDALAVYQEAVRLAPAERGLKANYSRFLEFFQSYRPKKPDEAAPAEGGEAKP